MTCSSPCGTRWLGLDLEAVRVGVEGALGADERAGRPPSRGVRRSTAYGNHHRAPFLVRVTSDTRIRVICSAYAADI